MVPPISGLLFRQFARCRKEGPCSLTGELLLPFLGVCSPQVAASPCSFTSSPVQRPGESSPLPDASSLRVPGPLCVVCEEPQLHGAAETHICRFSLSVYPVLRRPAHDVHGSASSSLARSSPGPWHCFWGSSCSFGPHRLGVPSPVEFMRKEWIGYSLEFGLPRPGWPAGEVPGPQTCCLLWLEMALEDAVGSFR